MYVLSLSKFEIMEKYFRCRGAAKISQIVLSTTDLFTTLREGIRVIKEASKRELTTRNFVMVISRYTYKKTITLFPGGGRPI